MNLVDAAVRTQRTKSSRERKAQARAQLDSRRRVATAVQASGMRVPVYFHELTIATRVHLFGAQDGVAQAMVAHQRHLARCGVKGDFETAT